MERKVIRKEVGRIKIEKLSEQGNKVKYLRTLASKSVECEQVESEQIWEQMKEAIVSSAKEVCGCAKVGSKNDNSEWWNEEVKKAVKNKKEAWLNVLKANDEVSKERCLEFYKEEKRNTKRCIRRRKQEVNEQFGRRMNEDIQGNRKLFWKEARKVKNENKGNLLRIMNRDGAFVTDEMDVRGVWKEHFENLHNINSNDEVIVNVCGFDGARRNRYFGDKVISKEEVMGRVRKLKNGKSAVIDEITGEMIKNEGEMVIDWIWKLCNKAFIEGIVPRDWRKAVIVPLYLSLIHISEPTRLLSISYAVSCLKKKNKTAR